MTPRSRRTMALVAAAMLVLGSLAVAEDRHGNTPLGATPVGVSGDLAAGCIDAPGDVDYFLFAADGGRRYILQTSHLDPEADTLLYLFDRDGRTILVVDNDSGREVTSRIEWVCPSSGTYFAMVRHAQATSGVGCYQFSIAAIQSDDHGNTAIGASPIVVDGSWMPGHLEIEGDVDVLFFLADAGYSYLIETDHLSEGMDTVIELRDTDGVTLLDEDDDSGTVRGSRISWSAPRTGTFFVFVRHAEPAGTGSYDLALRKLGYGDDHGNDPAGATPLDVHGGVVDGRIEVPGDTDVFSFDATADGEYSITLTASEGLDAQVQLLGQDRISVLQEAISRRGEAETATWPAPASETYYLVVEPLLGNASGSYTLRIEVVLQLKEIGVYNSPGYSLDVEVTDSLAYLIVGVRGLLILDLSDPRNPVEVGSHSTRGYAQAIDIVGRTAYVADRGDGVAILDLTNPTNPREVAVFDTSGSAQDVAVVDRYAYVADYRAGVQILDVSSPSAPTLAGSWETRGYAGAITVSDGIAYVAAGDAGIELIDVSDPTAPSGLGRLNLAGEALALALGGRFLYVAGGYEGVHVIDVADPTAPRWLATVETRGETQGLHRIGETLYVADTTGLVVYSLADPALPTPIAEVDTEGSAVSVFVAGQTAYVADREEGLRIIRLLP